MNILHGVKTLRVLHGAFVRCRKVMEQALLGQKQVVVVTITTQLLTLEGKVLETTQETITSSMQGQNASEKQATSPPLQKNTRSGGDSGTNSGTEYVEDRLDCMHCGRPGQTCTSTLNCPHYPWEH